VCACGLSGLPRRDLEKVLIFDGTLIAITSELPSVGDYSLQDVLRDYRTTGNFLQGLKPLLVYILWRCHTVGIRFPSKQNSTTKEEISLMKSTFMAETNHRRAASLPDGIRTED